MSTPISIVDAFAEHPFQGNPAAVCLLDEPAEAGWMQRVAAEMNLSETAFAVPNGAGFHLRWFTPRVEVDLCGHATLAAAHWLWEQGMVPAGEPIRFQTRSGDLTCIQREGKIELDFPAEPEREVPCCPELTAALGAEARYVGRNRFDILAEFPSEAAVRELHPDFTKLEAIAARGIIVTAPSTEPPFDFVSRFFAPTVGVNEDPVCGSAHCCLGPFWSARLGKRDLLGHQISCRGGIVGVRVYGDRVVLRGTAVTMLNGRLNAKPYNMYSD
jgi:PhzF family phenazine biosynthesis protein